MHELKTKETDRDVIEFIKSIENQRKREEAFQLLKIFTETTGYAAKIWGTNIIGFGKYHYKYSSGQEGDWFVAGFSPKKTKINLYFAAGDTNREELLKKFGKHQSGKSCVYINKVADINEDVLKEMIIQTVTFLKKTYS